MELAGLVVSNRRAKYCRGHFTRDVNALDTWA